MNKGQKAEIIKEHQWHEGDTGSAEVQIAELTSRILQLTGHMRNHKNDYQTQRSLLQMVGRRRRLLTDLNRENVSWYGRLLAQRGLRKEWG